MADVSIAGATRPDNSDERGTLPAPPRKRERPRPGLGAPGGPPAETEPPAHEGELDVVV